MTLLNHAEQHIMTVGKCREALRYETHALEAKEVDFSHKEISRQVQDGHAVVSPLIFFKYPPNLWF